MPLSAKIPLPDIYIQEYLEYKRITEKINRSTSGNVTFQNTDTLATYDTASTIYANQGEAGMALLLYNLDPTLKDYIFSDEDYGSISNAIQQALNTVTPTSGASNTVLVTLPSDYDSFLLETPVTITGGNITINGINLFSDYAQTENTTELEAGVYRIVKVGSAFFLASSGAGGNIAWLQEYKVNKFVTLSEAPSGVWINMTSVGTDIYTRLSASPDKLFKYDTLTDTWYDNLTVPSTDWGEMCAIGTDIYVRKNSSPYNMMKYDTLLDTWDETLASPSGVYYNFAPIGTDIYALRGSDYQQVWKYDTLLDTWDETLAVSGIGFRGLCTIGSELFTLDTSAIRKMYKYDTIGDSWSSSLGAPSRNVEIFNYDSFVGTDIYVPSQSPYDLFRFDTTTNTWYENEPGNMPDDRILYGAKVGDLLYYRYGQTNPYPIVSFDAVGAYPNKILKTDKDKDVTVKVGDIVYNEFGESIIQNNPRETFNYTTIVSSSSLSFGKTTREKVAVNFTTTESYTSIDISLKVRRNNNPSDSFKVSLYNSVSGEPTALIKDLKSFIGSTLPTSIPSDYNINISSFLTLEIPPGEYAIVLDRTGSYNDTNTYVVAYDSNQLGAPGVNSEFDGSLWNLNFSAYFDQLLTIKNEQIFPPITKATQASDLVATVAGTLEMNNPSQGDVFLGHISKVNQWLPSMEGANSSIKSIQRGNIVMTSTTANITIGEILPENSVVIITKENEGNASPSYAEPYARIIDSTTIQLATNQYSSSQQATIEWQVIEFNNVKSKQTGVTSVGLSSTETITEIDVNKSILFLTNTSQSTSTSSSYAVGMVRGNITNSTTLTFNIGVSSGSTAFANWQVIEFN